MSCSLVTHFDNEVVERTECVICYDTIQEGKCNSVVTECGHKFHTNCLMKNVAFNGFGCPYCRTKMAEKRADNSDSDDEDEDTRADDSDSDSVDEAEDPRDCSLYRDTFYGVNCNNYSDYALTSYRMLFQSANNEVLEEDAFDLSDAYLDELSEKLEKRGIDKNYIMRCILTQHPNFSRKLRLFEYGDILFDLMYEITEPLN